MADELTVACPSCGRQVDNVQAHEGYSCANWINELDDKGYAYYRDYQISFAFYGSGFEWVHKDFDGPEDNRAGHSHSVQGCCMDIDEREDF